MPHICSIHAWLISAFSFAQSPVTEMDMAAAEVVPINHKDRVICF